LTNEFLTQLYIPLEISTQTVAELGEVGMLEINDVSLKTRPHSFHF
jgi:hypothetical protein